MDAMRLEPVLGPIQLVFYCVGVIIGAGVYSVIGVAAGQANESLWLSFLIAAVVALLTGFSYAEMTTSFPHAGAEYIYLKRAFPKSDFASFSIGLMILIGGAATATTVAVAFGGYLRTFVDIPVTISAFVLLLGCTAFNIWGLRESSWANVILTSIEIAGLLIVIVAGFTEGNLSRQVPVQWHAGVMPAAAILFFVYLGFEEIANLTEEVRDPARDLPRSIFFSIGITTLLYILVSVAVIALASPADLAASQAPLALAVQKAWPGAGNFLSAIALFATANTVLITLIATSRLAFSMGRDGEIPKLLAIVLPGRGTPWIAAVLCFAMCVALLPIDNVKILAELSSFSALLAFMAVNLALVVLRYRLPNHGRPFRVPLSIGRLPLLPVAAMISIVVLLVHFDWQIYLAGVAALVFTGVAFIARQAFRETRR